VRMFHVSRSVKLLIVPTAAKRRRRWDTLICHPVGDHT